MSRKILTAILLLFAAALAAAPQTVNTFCASSLACTVSGVWTYSSQMGSTVSTGTAPFSIASTTVVPNLNAQLHGGLIAPASAIVGISDTQTLTNKTLTAPTVTNPTTTGTDSGTETLTNKTTTGLVDNGTQLTAKRFVSNGPAPTCSVTGAGTGASCGFTTATSDSAGTMLFSTGTTPSSSGTLTLTFNSSFTSNGYCTFTLANGNSSWNTRATLIETGGGGGSNVQTMNWDNNSVNLTASQASSVAVVYTCIGR